MTTDSCPEDIGLDIGDRPFRPCLVSSLLFAVAAADAVAIVPFEEELLQAMIVDPIAFASAAFPSVDTSAVVSSYRQF